MSFTEAVSHRHRGRASPSSQTTTTQNGSSEGNPRFRDILPRNRRAATDGSTSEVFSVGGLTS